MTKTLIELGGLIVSADEVIDEPGYLVMAEGRIAALGRGTYSGDRADLQVIQRRRSLAIPGLVNAHGHAAMTLLRGIGTDLTLQDWLFQRIFPAEDILKRTEDAIYWGTLLACLEMIQSGTTCFTDMYMQMHDVARAVEGSGMRAVLSWGMAAGNRAEEIANTVSFIERWHQQATGRITTTLGPHAPYTCPPDYLKEIAELAGKLDIPIQIHLSETRLEVENSWREWGCSPIQHVDRCGLFDHPMLAAHCVHVSAEDLTLMAKKQVHVAHNPQSNLKLASGIAPLIDMRRAGLTVGLGTDGAASNNNLDMFEEMRLAATLHKATSGDPTAIPAADAFRMATQESARAVFLPEGHGTLKTGNAADVVLLSLDTPHLVPSHDLLANVVYAAGADDVTDVFVQGRALLLNREPQTIDAERVLFEARRIGASL